MNEKYSKTAAKAVHEIKQKFERRCANQFLVWGNINDYIPLDGRFVSLKEYLTEWLIKRVEVLVFFDMAAGFQFLDQNQEKLFREVTGFTKPKPNIDERTKRGMSLEELENLQKAIERLENSSEPPLPTKPCEALKLIEMAIAGNNKNSRKLRLAVCIEYAETIAPSKGALSNDDRISIVALRRLAEESIAGESLLILLAGNIADVNDCLRGRGSRLKSIEIPFPLEPERLSFIKHMPSKDSFRQRMTNEELAHNTGGLNLREIEDTCRQFDALTFEIITKEKTRYIDEELKGVVKVMNPRFGIDCLGGLEEVKAYCSELKPALIKGDARIVPPAVMLMGPPGTGKSALAEAMAWEWGVPFVEILNNRSMWHGESERITIEIMSILIAISPCVLFWDEFDQEEAPRGSYVGDSGVSSRLRKIRFQITSDPGNRGKLLVIYATNRVDLIDSADKRSGRASMRIPMLLPDANEQEKIFWVMPKRYEFEIAVKNFTGIVNTLVKRHGDLISGADIEEISLAAFRQSALRNHKRVEESDYAFAINDFVPQHRYNSEKLCYMEDIAVKERSSNRFLSKKGWEILKRIEGCG